MVSLGGGPNECFIKQKMIGSHLSMLELLYEQDLFCMHDSCMSS